LQSFQTEISPSSSGLKRRARSWKSAASQARGSVQFALELGRVGVEKQILEIKPERLRLGLFERQKTPLGHHLIEHSVLGRELEIQKNIVLDRLEKHQEVGYAKLGGVLTSKAPMVVMFVGLQKSAA
jgi:hypothetical protein